MKEIHKNIYGLILNYSNKIWYYIFESFLLCFITLNSFNFNKTFIFHLILSQNSSNKLSDGRNSLHKPFLIVIYYRSTLTEFHRVYTQRRRTLNLEEKKTNHCRLVFCSARNLKNKYYSTFYLPTQN